MAHCEQGKSTLCNHLLGRERSLTGPEPGLTRDAVAEDFEWQGHSIELVDSAGWVKAAKLPEDGCRCVLITLRQIQCLNSEVAGQHNTTSASITSGHKGRCATTQIAVQRNSSQETN